MKVEAENITDTEASAELIRELMSDDARRGNWLILMHDDDEGAFMQIAFDDHPDGIELEYREGVDTPLYHCRRTVLRLEAENALLDYLDGIDTWKYRFEWEEVKGFGGVGGAIRRFVPGPVLFVALLVAAVAGVIYIGKLPRNMRILPVAAVIASLLVESAQMILRDGSADTDLKVRGLRICARGTKIARRKAVTVVARALAVLMAAMLKKPDAPYAPLSERYEKELLAMRAAV